MAIGAVLLTAVAVAWLYLLWSRRRFYMCALRMKGPWGYPFMGIAHKLYKVEELLYVLPNLAREYKQKTFFTWLGPFPSIYTIDPNVVEMVLQSPDCLDKGIPYQGLDDALGSGLLTSELHKWTKHRKLLSPSFGYKVLLGLIPNFNNFARDLCGQMDKCVGCGEVDILELALKIGIKSSFAAFMGIDVQGGSDSKIIKSFEGIFETIVYRTLRPLLFIQAIFSLTKAYKTFLKAKICISNFIQDLLKSKLKSFENGNPDTKSEQDLKDNGRASQIFIDQIISYHQQNEFTIDDVVSEIGLMMFASYETTGRAFYSTLMFLAMHPQYQERVFDEISSLYPEKEFDVTNEDFKSMVYLEMCINESMRLAPSIPLISRACGKDLRISEDITVPAGVDIHIDIFNIHRDEDIWGPTAKTFNPDHFLPSNLESKPKCAFLPFSRGKRNCIGWQYAGMFLKVMLAQVIRKYKFSTTFPYEDLKFVECISVRYATTPRLEVQRR